ncbi:MAG: SAM-dependent methyltransferase [Betaproteobacteria bacterium]|nr:SAM-dependent methyltransferase [Betaproteobacteria bacterium]
MNTSLPEPSADARAASAALCSCIASEIAAAGGWISFARYMALALYAPGLGYYSGGARKFGAAGDFITAPELTSVFAQTLAVQAMQVMADSAAHILEAGAGSGVLAAELLRELERLGALPERYLILELSGELRARQQATLAERVPQLLARVTWLESLPQTFSGLVLGNEVLDAMPVELVEWRGTTSGGAPDIFERGVALDEGGSFTWAGRPAQGALLQAAQRLNIEAPYVSEIGLAAQAWIAEWSHILESGVVLLFDYGFPRHEYYHPQRSSGTLMCHYRHRAHDDPLWWPGLNDITAHVDFTAIAEAGFEAGLEVIGYTSQARFLFNCGIMEALDRLPRDDDKTLVTETRNVGKLISPHEMGELFKVIALGRGLKQPLRGFASGDRTPAL